MDKILIIDDEPGIRSSLSMVLEDEKYTVSAAEDAPTGLALMEKEDFAIILLDVWLPKMGGMDALDIFKEKWPDKEVIIISGHGNVDMAVRAVKKGAFDFLEKPLAIDKVLTTVRNALSLQKLKLENRGLKQAMVKEELIGSSSQMESIRQIIDQSAKSDARILITGENGTGKEVVARAIHRNSLRNERPFVEVNCAAIPDTLIESELFGHEKGAFTDAISMRKGRFELAHGGTLFLDEIGDMSLQAQAKVLRAIQEQKIERVGGEKVIEVDVRIIAATNKDLHQACKEGSFREDLYFRLNVIPIPLPPLRERGEDVVELLTVFLKQLGHSGLNLDSAACDYLMEYKWPGNVRELRNLAERITILHDGEHLGADDLTHILHYQDIQQTEAFSKDHLSDFGQKLFGMTFADAKDGFERAYLEHNIKKHAGVVAKTAEAIGMYPSNLHAKIKKLGLRVGD